MCGLHGAVWRVTQSHCFVTSHEVTTSGSYRDIGDCSLITTLSWRPPQPLYFVILTAAAVIVSLFLNSPLVSCGALTSHIITSVKYVPVHCHQSSRSEHRVTNRVQYIILWILDTGEDIKSIRYRPYPWPSVDKALYDYTIDNCSSPAVRTSILAIA